MADGNPKASPASKGTAKKEAQDALRAAGSRGRSASAKSGGPIQPEIEEAEDWVVSYMDMVTLLMIVFLGMVAIMSLKHKFDAAEDKSRVIPLGQAAAKPDGRPELQSPPALPNSTLPNPTLANPTLAKMERDLADLPEPPATAPAPMPPAKPKSEPAANPDPPLSPESRRLLDKLAKAGLPSDVEFSIRDKVVVIQIADKVLFSSGQADLQPAGARVIGQIVPILMVLHGTISIEGHTDDVPISGPRFPSNWELSSARAGAVARFLEGQAINRNRLRIIGYADTQPIAVPPAGRALNRRVALIIEPD